MISTHPPISISSSLLSNLSGIVPSGRFIIGITVTFMFHRCFSFLARSKYMSFIIIIIYSLEFYTSTLADGFHWSLSDSKSPRVSRTLLSILAVLNNVVVWMVSTRPPTSKSSSPFSNPLVTVPNAPITIGIIVTSMFHSFFNSLARSRYLSFFSYSFSFIPWTAKSTILQFLFFFFVDYYQVWSSGRDLVICAYVKVP